MVLQSSDALSLRTVSVEFLATLLLVFTGCGATIAVSKDDDLSSKPYLNIALAWGLAYATLTQTFAHLSGAHMNPAITLSFLVTRRISVRVALIYMAIQMAASITGAAILDSVSGQNRFATLGLTTIASNVSSGAAFGMEFIITFLVVLAWFSLIDSQTHFAGSVHMSTLHFGAVVTLVHLIALPFTGCSINPVRSFGPAVVTNTWSQHWVFWLGPLAGGVLGALLHSLWMADGSAKLHLHDVFGLRPAAAAVNGDSA